MEDKIYLVRQINTKNISYIPIYIYIYFRGVKEKSLSNLFPKIVYLFSVPGKGGYYKSGYRIKFKNSIL